MIDDPKLAADCLLAVVGLLPKRVTAANHRAAELLPAKFERRALAWWGIDERPAAPALAELDADALFDKLPVDDVAGATLTEWLREAGDDVERIEDLKLALPKVRRWMRDRIPRIVIPTFAGPRVMPMAVDDAAEVASLFAVLNHAERVLDEMDAGSLTPSQAEAFRQNFPALAKFYGAALDRGSSAKAAKDPDWWPTEEQEILCGILSGNPPGLLTSHAPPPAEAPPPKLDKDLGARNSETQADKSSRPKSAQK